MQVNGVYKKTSDKSIRKDLSEAIGEQEYKILDKLQNIIDNGKGHQANE